MNNYSCNLQIVSFSAVKNGFISPAGVGNRALGGDPQPSRGWTVGSSSPSSLSLPVWTLQGSPCTPQTPPEKAATVPQERWKHCAGFWSLSGSGMKPATMKIHRKQGRKGLSGSHRSAQEVYPWKSCLSSSPLPSCPQPSPHHGERQKQRGAQLSVGKNTERHKHISAECFDWLRA